MFGINFVVNYTSVFGRSFIKRLKEHEFESGSVMTVVIREAPGEDPTPPRWIIDVGRRKL